MRILANWERFFGSNVVEPGARTGSLGLEKRLSTSLGPGRAETSTAQAIAARAVACPPDFGGIFEPLLLRLS
jgi:hypothetical protein